MIIFSLLLFLLVFNFDVKFWKLSFFIRLQEILLQLILFAQVLVLLNPFQFSFILILQTFVPLNEIHIWVKFKVNQSLIDIFLNLSFGFDFFNFGKFLNNLKIFLLVVVRTANDKPVSISASVSDFYVITGAVSVGLKCRICGKDIFATLGNHY